MDTSLEVLRLVVLAAAEFFAHVVDSMVHFFDHIANKRDVIVVDPDPLHSVDYSVLLDFCRHVPDLCRVFV